MPQKTHVHLDPFTYVQVHQSPTHHWHCTSKLYVLKLYVSLQSYGHLMTFAWYQSPPSTFTFRFPIFFVPIACTCTCTCFMCYNSHVHKQKDIWGTVILYHICLFWNWTVIVFFWSLIVIQFYHVKVYNRLTELAHGGPGNACLLVRSWSHRWLVQAGNDGKTSNGTLLHWK